MCLNTGTPKNINFSFETNGKLMALCVPILKHFRVLRKGQKQIWTKLSSLGQEPAFKELTGFAGNNENL